MSALLALGFASLASAANAVRISQVYGGGSGTSAPYNADFVELYNSGASSVSIAGWTITYTSTTGDFGGNQFTFPAGASIPASSYLCVQMQATGTVGAAVPFDFIAATAINLNATGGNVALLTAAQTGDSNTCASLAATLVDKVAYGSGNCPEGTAASAPSSTTAIIRKGNGATDTDANSSDFFVATPYPRNLSFTQSVIATTGSTLAADGWTLASSGTVSSGIASSDGNGGTNGLAGNQAWRLGAATGASITATRAITTAAGMVVALDFDNGTVASSTSTGIEFLSGTTTALKFHLAGGSANYSIVDSAGTVATTLAATTSGVRVSVLLSASGAYTLTAGAYTRSGTLAGSATTFSSIRVFDTAVGTTAATLVYFNHLRVGFNSLTSTVTAGSIPDNSTVGRVVSFPMTATQIPAGTAVRDVRVTLTGLAHQNAGDVSAVVIAPDGTSSPLFIRPGATNSGGTGADVANFATDYSFADSAISNLWTATSGTSTTNVAAGWYFPSVLFTGARSALSSSFAGKDPVGTWQVKVTDLATGTTGTLTSATLELRIGADSDGDDAADIFDGCPSNGALLAPATYYIDADNDGYGSTTTTTSCESTPPAGTSANSTDCNDASAAINPGATELCDGIDQNCNGIADDGFADADGDGVGNCVDTNLTYTIAGAAIPDATSATPNVPGVLNKTFVVTSGQIPGAISDVRVTFVGLTHTYMGDVTASLIAPNGTTALIIGRVGATAAVPYGDASDYGGNYAFFDAATASIWTAAAAAGTTAITPAGSYYPSTTLTGARVALTNAFTGVVAAGTWTVRLTDSTNVDVGSVTTIIVDLTPSAEVDTDGDGTPDSQDGCPNDPNKIAVGACGCGVAETDSDGDGTPNCIDGCPSDPNKIAPGACGCGVPNTDSDGDGTPNCNDACPNDPNKIAAGTCGCGVADTDSDSDGTPNCNDLCPNDPLKIAAGTCGCGVADTDSDSDGTPNCNDLCPNDPLKIAAGTCGCGVADTDSDSDGTPNCNDLCPNDPLKIAAGTCGCGVADTDSDSDGTPNCNDLCPNDPLKIAAGTCGCGVAETDSDSDGTPNCNDGCPNDPNKTSPGSCGCGFSDTSADTDGDGTFDCTDGCPNDPLKIAAGTCGCGVVESAVDSDVDGVPDCLDTCPNDPLKTAPGACGCGVVDTDSDSDGTPNCNDLCPNDPLKIAVGACGCGVAETDSDSDGTPDCNDLCPNDPLKIAAGTCGCGVADTDSDSDGTPNCNDLCPNDPLKIAAGACGCGVVETDSDSDGTPNCNDGCPNDPLKIAAGACGCGVVETDSDSDGTPNCLDTCPNDPLKTSPGACGCGVAETDSDGDGTPNCNDLCPNDPLKTAAGTCGCGVADTDSDSDGTPNCNDLCPNDPLKVAAGTCGCGVADTDSDSDGTPNCNDLCPNDPLKLAPGTCGCGVAETDSDADGTPNCTDGCPNDPLKIAAGACGCGVVETDSDSDGTPNCNDLCPNDPLKIAAGTCGCGVSDVDSDGDGAADCVDETLGFTLTGGSIPDNNATGLVKTFTVPSGALATGISAVKVTLTGLTHTWAGDLTATLTSPDGTSVKLFERIAVTASTVNGEDSDFNGTYRFADSFTTSIWTAGAAVNATTAIAPGDYYPSVITTGARGYLVAGLVGHPLTGTWTLKITDGVAADTGAITSANVEFTQAPAGDSDGDGTQDGLDGCPNDANKIAAGTCGCGVPDSAVDSDGDSIVDCLDTTFTRTVTGASITDNNATGLVRTFTIPAGEFPAGVTDVTVSFANITHGNMGDLTATLESPTGIVVSLFSRVGATTTTGTGDSSNFSGAYDFKDSATTSLWTVAAAGGSSTNIASGNYYPSAALNGARVALTAAFTGSTLSGTWTLRVKDTISSNTGSYSTATIDFTPGEMLDSDGDGTPDASDGCPNDANKIAAGTCGCGVAETDSDADGTPNCIDACPNDPNKIAAGACGCGAVETDSDSDGTPNCIDACPNDANKIAAGACGCGSPDVDANTNGTIDCLEITPTVSITVVGGGSSFGAGDTFTVRVAHSNPGRNISQARLSIGYDASALLPVSVQPTAGSPFSEQVMLQISEANGTIRTITRAPNGSGAAANDSDITFVVLPGANVCSASGVVNSTTIAGNPTQLVSVDGGLLDPILSPLGLIRADGLAPVFSGIPNSVSIPTDAGSTAGAVISAPVISASDNCDGARAVTISVLYPDATTGNAWPVNDLFPVGTSVVTFATGDSVGNNTSTSRTVEVGNYQYLDVAIALGGTVSGNSTRPIRISVGSTLTVVNVSMTGASGAISNFQVLATQTPPCVAVKDTNHSIATANIASVVGTEYALSVELTQGDCNDDNRIDILDFGTFVASRGASVASNAISNFNADTIVNNSDLSFISVNFFHIGDTCGSYTGDPALERIKVKDLRRAGMGHLDIADLNHDGWLDSGDIAHYLQFGGPTGPSARPGTETGVQWPR